MRGTLRDQFRGKHPFFWVVVIAAVYGACAWVFTVAMQYKYAGLEKDGYEWGQELRIGRIYPGGPAEGKLQPGDVIRTINGKPTTSYDFSQAIRFAPVGTIYKLEIERNEKRQPVELKLILHDSPDASDIQHLAILASLLSFSALLIAILAGLLRPSDATVRLFFATFFIIGLCFPGLRMIQPLLNEIEIQFSKGFITFSNQFLAAAMLFHLFLRFPPGLPVSRFWQLVKWGFYIAGIPLHLAITLYFWNIKELLSGLAPFFDLFFLTIIPATVLVGVRNYRRVKEPQQRQRIKWIISGTVVAISSFLLLIFFQTIVWPRVFEPMSDVARKINLGLLYLANLALLGSFVAWAYAILKHRVLDINVVIRRSLRYLLASRGFILIEALLAFALLSFLFAGRIGAALDRLGSNTRTLITIFGSVLMVLGLQTVNRKIRPLIDRRFFRDAYDAQQILTELTSSLRATTNVNEVLELTTAKIQQALYAENVTIFLRNGQHDFSSAVSSDYHEREKLSQSVARELHLPDAAFVVQRVNASSQPAEIDWDDPYSPVATQLAAMANGDAAAQQEFDTLRELKTNLVLPLAAKDELLGVLALGPRAGDLPYSREDKRMLMNVAGQTAMALENSRLIEQKIELEAQNEQRAKELEEARQLQLSMLPKKVPQLPHLEIAAYMKTATEVGGDYYDFHVADDGTLTIAVGDATGHGLRAGMMVTATKSLFNELVREPDLPELMRRCSRALKAMNLRGLFMALTIARINGNRLTITSAGMPAALLYRAAEQRVEELLFKSMPLGSITNYVYKQQEAAINAGDVLVLLSDGLPERFNGQSEMLGEEAAVRVLREVAQWSSSEIIQRLVQSGDDWGGARPQDDDATFVVVRMK